MTMERPLVDHHSGLLCLSDPPINNMTFDNFKLQRKNVESEFILVPDCDIKLGMAAARLSAEQPCRKQLLR